ncbi:MAG: calcium/sodium antiporter [Clostridia bacterium]|nr:calcium/sodium antiporter [Clostridia bacterium]
MFLNIILLIIGFVMLIKGADILVDGASSLARNFKLSAMFIGLTIVSFGTSAPEFAVSVQSLLKGSGDIVLGNVIGSNILNILLIVGVSAMVHFLTVKNDTVKKEIPIILLISTLLIVLMNDSIFGLGANSFTRQDGVTVCLFFLVFIYYLIRMMRNKKDPETEEGEIKYSIPKSLLFVAIGLIGIIVGSNFVVDSASNIALALGVSERMVALTIVALGTSLPELVTSVTATKKGEYDIAIGNVVGSNIFNIGIVLGLPVALLGGISNITFSMVDLAVMLLAALLIFIFGLRDRKINKKEGIIMLTIFVVYYSYVIFA